MKQRDKLEINTKRKFQNVISEESLLSTPILDRTIEKYINIGDTGWQYRYYKELFDIDIDDTFENEKFVLIILEGLEWNFKYYTKECPDWGWHYKYKYPPLLEDLCKYIPEFDTHLLKKY